ILTEKGIPHGYSRSGDYHKSGQKDLETFINIIDTPIWLLQKGKKGKLYYAGVNSAYSKLLGIRKEVLIGEQIDNFQGSGISKLIYENISNARKKRKLSFITEFIVHENPMHYLVNIYSSPQYLKPGFYICTATDVNDLHQISEELYKEKNEKNNYLEIAGVVILVVDITGKIKLINKKGAEILGYKRSEIIGSNWFQKFVPKDSSKQIYSRFKQLMKGKEPESYFTNHILTKNNERRLIYWHSSTIKDEKGNVCGLLSSGEDITENEKVQSELLLNSRNMDFMYNLSRSISNTSDLGELLKKSAKLISAYPEVIGGMIYIYNDNRHFDLPDRLVFGKETRTFHLRYERLIDKFLTRKNGKHYSDIEKLNFDRYGKTETVYIGSYGMYTRGEPQGLLCLINKSIDSTRSTFFQHIAIELSRGVKRKKSEVEHQMSEKRFSAIFNTTPDAMAITSLDEFRFVEINNGFQEMTGYSRKDSIGKTVFELNSWVYPNERSKLNNLLQKNNKVSGFLTTLRRKDGSMFNALFSAVYIDFYGNKCMLSVVKDISDRVKIEKEILETKQLLERITKTSPSYISLYNVKEDKILFANKSLLVDLGYSEKELSRITELTALDRYKFYHPDDVENVKEMDRKILKLRVNDIIKADYRIKDVNDNWLWFQHSAAVFQKQTRSLPLLTVNVFENINERKIAEELSKIRSEEIEFLYNAARSLSGSLDLNEIYDNMYTLISRIADCKELIVTSFDEENKEIVYKYLRSRETNNRVDVSSIPPIPLAPPGFGIISQVVRSGESVIMGDYRTDSMKVKTRFIINEFGQLTEEHDDSREPRSAMIIPIKLKNKILGVVQIFSLKKDGYTKQQLRLVESMMSQVALANNNAMLYEKAQQEITERTLAEGNLKKSEENLRNFAESVPDVLYRINYKTDKFEFLSPVIEKMLGYNVKEIIGDPYLFKKKIILPEDLDYTETTIMEYVKAADFEYPLEVECRMIKKNNEIIWVRDLIKFETENGKVTATIGAMSDITQMKIDEEKRRKRDEQTISYQQALLELSRLKNTNLEETFRSICEITSNALKADRISIWLFNGENEMECMDSYDEPAKVHSTGAVLNLSGHRNFFAMLKTDEKILSTEAEKDSVLRDISETLFKPFGTNISLISRIRLHGDVIGMICIEARSRNKMEWSPEEYDFAVTVAGFITLALETREHIIADQEIKKSLKDKELLLREIHHRVKNNLQVISSLLYLQSKKSADPLTINALFESQQRIKSMVLIHEKLYQSNDLSNINYADYVSSLTNTLFRSYSLDSSRIELKMNIGEIRFKYRSCYISRSHNK
ncbi:MAG: PAS domain S-box protein, partial [Ignavibacteria bacterium]